MSGPDNVILGDNTGVELPQKPEDTDAVNELRRKAKYSRSKEYAELRQKAQARIDFYQKFLPNGQPIGTANKGDMERKWELANLLIAEFEQLFGEHENAAQILKDEYNE